MTHATSTTNVQAVHAALGKELTRRGWTSHHEPNDAHPGATTATTHIRHGIRVLILSLRGRHGQMIEITAAPTTGSRRQDGRRVRDSSPSWRLTAYAPPTEAILAAAMTATTDSHSPGLLESLGWSITHAANTEVGGNAFRGVRATRFTSPGKTVTATFYTPSYTPPCEHCTHYGELGDTGGWDISGSGFTAEATAHTPAPVIEAFLRALPRDHRKLPRPAPPAQPHDSHPTKTTLAAKSMHGVRLTAVVR